MSMGFDAGRAGAIRRLWPVAVEAQSFCRLNQLRVVAGSVNVVATEAGDPMAVHDALDEVVPLHTVLVGGAIGEVVEIGGAQRWLFQLPEILQLETDLVSH